MPAITGKDLYVAFCGTDISGDYRKFDPAETNDLVDQSAGDDANKTYLPTLKDGNASYTALLQSDGSAIWTAVALGTEGTLEWGEEGTAATNARHWVNAIVKDRSKTMPYDGVVELTVNFQFSGAITDTVYAA